VARFPAEPAFAILNIAMAPRVSVIIPTYNRSAALRATADSVLRQSFPDWELVVVDDGSTDDTAEVARSYTDPRISVITQPNGGHSAARNAGLERAVGEYVAFLDHDDRWRPEKLALQTAYLDQHPNCSLVYGAWETIDEEGKPQGPGNKARFEGKVTGTLLREHNFVQSMSLPMMRTEQVRAVGGFRAVMDICDDLDLFLRLSRIGEFGYLPQVLMDYNVGIPDQQSRAKTRGCLSLYRCITHHLHQDTTLTREEKTSLRRRIVELTSHEIRCQGWLALRRGELPLSWRTYFLALRMRPALLGDRNLLRDMAVLARNSLAAAFGRRKRLPNG
jgi:glycosyltransferase involved in cell wall biosynthesis